MTAVIGTIFSACVLFLIGVLNLLSAVEIVRSRRRSQAATAAAAALPPHDAKAGVAPYTHSPNHGHVGYIEEDGTLVLDDEARVGGLISRCCPAVFNAVTSQAGMYGVGFLFGIGFETSSEVRRTPRAPHAKGAARPGAGRGRGRARSGHASS